MRGLTGPRSSRTRSTPRAAITATAVIAAVALITGGCGAGGTGARDEGPAHADPEASTSTPAAPPTKAAPPAKARERIDAVRLLKSDPNVSARIKQTLRPCVADVYPVDVSYGNLTGGPVDDVVVNVLTCGDALGLGSYVYRDRGGVYVNVFTAEDLPVYAEIDRGDLVVTKRVYDHADPASYPSGEIVFTYRWNANGFVEKYRTRNDYGQVAETPRGPEKTVG